MRWSDINKLTWAEVQEFDGGTRIVFRQKRPKGWNTSTSQAKPCATWVSAARPTSGSSPG